MQRHVLPHLGTPAGRIFLKSESQLPKQTVKTRNSSIILVTGPNTQLADVQAHLHNEKHFKADHTDQHAPGTAV